MSAKTTASCTAWARSQARPSAYWRSTGDGVQRHRRRVSPSRGGERAGEPDERRHGGQREDGHDREVDRRPRGAEGGREGGAGEEAEDELAVVEQEELGEARHVEGQGKGAAHDGKAEGPGLDRDERRAAEREPQRGAHPGEAEVAGEPQQERGRRGGPRHRARAQRSGRDLGKA